MQEIENKYIKVYYPLMHKSAECRLTDTECVVFCILLSYMVRNAPGCVYNKKVRMQSGYCFYMKIFDCLNLDKAWIHRVLAKLDRYGFIKRFPPDKRGRCQVSILKPPHKKDQRFFKLHRSVLGKTTLQDNLITAYLVRLEDKYKCIDYHKFTHCGYWGVTTLRNRIKRGSALRYKIDGKVYYIAPKVVEQLGGVDYTQAEYDKVASMGYTNVYKLNSETNGSALGILQILYKKGVVTADEGGKGVVFGEEE